MANRKTILLYSTLFVVFGFFLGIVLIKAQVFLVPTTTAVILALLILPLSHKLEELQLNRVTASLINSLFLFIISLGFMALFSFQVKNIVDDWGEIKHTLYPKVEQLKEVLIEHVPIGENSLEIDEKDISIDYKNTEFNTQKGNLFSQTGIGFVGSYLLTFIYTFFILNYRQHFKEFLLRLFPKEKGEEVKVIIHRVAKVTQQYLIGKTFLIAILAVLYAIGLGFSRVDNFIIISILAATLSLIPYIGNVIGFGIALIFGYLTSGETVVLIGVIITFSVAQFVESYILEPYIVGERVDLHPFFVILTVVIGNFLWGIMGMILAIPILAMINVILLDIPNLHAIGYLISNKPPSEKL